MSEPVLVRIKSFLTPIFWPEFLPGRTINDEVTGWPSIDGMIESQKDLAELQSASRRRAYMRKREDASSACEKSGGDDITIGETLTWLKRAIFEGLSSTFPKDNDTAESVDLRPKDTSSSPGTHRKKISSTTSRFTTEFGPPFVYTQRFIAGGLLIDILWVIFYFLPISLPNFSFLITHFLFNLGELVLRGLGHVFRLLSDTLIKRAFKDDHISFLSIPCILFALVFSPLWIVGKFLQLTANFVDHLHHFFSIGVVCYWGVMHLINWLFQIVEGPSNVNSLEYSKVFEPDFWNLRITKTVGTGLMLAVVPFLTVFVFLPTLPLVAAVFAAFGAAVALIAMYSLAKVIAHTCWRTPSLSAEAVIPSSAVTGGQQRRSPGAASNVANALAALPQSPSHSDAKHHVPTGEQKQGSSQPLIAEEGKGISLSQYRLTEDHHHDGHLHVLKNINTDEIYTHRRISNYQTEVFSVFLVTRGVPSHLKALTINGFQGQKVEGVDYYYCISEGGLSPSPNSIVRPSSTPQRLLPTNRTIMLSSSGLQIKDHTCSNPSFSAPEIREAYISQNADGEENIVKFRNKAGNVQTAVVYCVLISTTSDLAQLRALSMHPIAIEGRVIERVQDNLFHYCVLASTFEQAATNTLWLWADNHLTPSQQANFDVDAPMPVVDAADPADGRSFLHTPRPMLSDGQAAQITAFDLLHAAPQPAPQPPMSSAQPSKITPSAPAANPTATLGSPS